MSRTFVYCRVSTVEQTTENQVLKIQQSGYDVSPQRVVSETISGSVEAMKRPAFKALVDHKLEAGDTLVVLKLDRLGRDNIDVQQTITTLTKRGINLVSLDLGKHDLTSSEGKLMLQIFSAFAEFERNRIRERTQAGLERAKKDGKTLGRPAATNESDVQKLKAEGLSQSAVAKELSVSLSTVKRLWNPAK
ncbi:recombinase family protein [Stutzerimonas stutzeri]|uniref:recombinase family protein n=1 Tax=Stutzerimonas stutzeri TaxID=316 RepID=UPI003EBB9258